MVSDKLPRASEPDAIAGRIGYLLQHVWFGNQSEMARDLGCSQSLISKVVAGERSPGHKLMQALTEHPTINKGWLIAGEGPPLAVEAGAGTSG